jgi:hypothetical protein
MAAITSAIRKGKRSGGEKDLNQLHLSYLIKAKVFWNYSYSLLLGLHGLKWITCWPYMQMRLGIRVELQ